jgi:hypothetical protein
MKVQRWIALSLVLAAVLLATGTYLYWWSLSRPAGAFVLHHAMVIAGAAYILVVVPVYSYVKRHANSRRAAFLKAHVFGNLAAFALISAHFSFQMARPAEFGPVLGTGLSAYVLVLMLITTGIMQRFGVAPHYVATWRSVHVGLAVSLYVVVGVHALHNFGLL